MKLPVAWIAVAVSLLPPAPCRTQDLAELARMERARRAAAGAVRYRIESIPSSGETETRDPPDAASKKTRAAANSGKAPPPVAASDKRLEDLARRGPTVWHELQKANQRLADMEKELRALERTGTPVWRRGVMLENPALVKKRSEVERCRRRQQELDQEWKWLQDRARRLGMEPGVLRGTH